MLINTMRGPSCTDNIQFIEKCKTVCVNSTKEHKYNFTVSKILGTSHSHISI